MRNIYSNLILFFKKLYKSENMHYVINNILFVIFSVIITITYILGDNIKHLIDRSEITLSVLNTQYDGYVDKDVFCKSIECKYIGSLNSDIILNANTLKEVQHDNIISLYNFHLIDKIYYSINNKSDVYYLDITNTIMSITYPGVFILVIYIITLLSVMSKALKEKNLDSIDILKNSEYINKYDTLFGLASNINHEVSTPLNVIKSIFEDYRYTNEEFTNYIKKLTCDNCTFICTVDETLQSIVLENLETSKENVELGMIAVSQIYDEMAAINNYKNVAISNNESIYVLIQTAVKLLNKISIIDINECSIDVEFKKNKLYTGNGMTNMLFVSMVINHLKNSIEANANKITINYNDECVFISDNGNGIPSNVVKHIFDNDFSTKQSEDILRGNGLYINKLLLNNKYDGDITLIESIPNVITTFCLKIKMERI